MLPPLVVTKYTLPPPRPRLVQRERLVGRLLAGLDGKLTLIAAPAGFGKSTLAAELARRAGRRTAWLSLDPGDNDPVTWGAYLAAAIRHAGMPVADLPEIPPPAALIATLINDLTVAGEPLLLIFDDYHLIDAAEIHAAVALLLDRQPPNLHLVIASRVRPPLPLARLRAAGDLTEVTAMDLRFSAAEATAFLRITMGVDVPEAGAATLFARTEGWAAGLQLGAVSLGPSPDWETALDRFSGQNPDLLDYLVDEVLARQPEPVQRFLRQTAILERLTGPLCEAVTGQPGGQQTLAHIEQANLFLFPLDPERRWYRYHPLFAEFLRASLHREAGDAGVAELHRRAADWFYRESQIDTAVDHLLAAGAFDQAADWLEEAFLAPGGPGPLVTMRRWIGRLPVTVLRNRPVVAMMAAWSLIAAGEVQEEAAFARALDYLAWAERALRPGAAAEASVARGLLAAVRLSLAPWAPLRLFATGIKEDAARAAQLARLARELLPEDALFWRSVVSHSLGAVFHRASAFALAAEAFGEAARLGARSGSLTATLAAKHRQVALLVALGQLHAARDACRDALRLAADLGGQALPTLAPVYLDLGLLHLEWNELDAAAEHLGEALRRYEAGGREEPRACLALARLHQARGDDAAAGGWLDRAAKLLTDGSRLRAAETAIWPEGVKVLLARGDVAGARRWTEAAGVRPDPQPDLWRAAEYFALARVLTAEGAPATALPLLRTLSDLAAATGCRGLEAEGRLIETLALHAGGDLRAAKEALQAALALTAAEGPIRAYVDGGKPVAALLGEIAGDLRRGAMGDAALRSYVDRLAAVLPTAPLAEPLTPREQEILRLVAAGSSNQDVARELYMGVSTVKWHLINLFGKLQVRNRTEAVARARELGLL